jgi:succinyl-diaminopimelate desuccinylase
VSQLASLAAELVAIPSPSHEEAAIAERVAAVLAEAPHLEVRRIGDNVIARTERGLGTRVLIAGHLDTVRSTAGGPQLDATRLRGLGAADMKGTLAVMLSLAVELAAPTADVTWLFYAREEVDRSESGLLELAAAAPELLEADVAILGEPTSAAVEAGCQGTLRLEVRLSGVSAHTARPFMGRNAIRRLALVLAALAEAEPRTVELDGVRFVEQLEPVAVSGGLGGNVIPDKASVVVNHRFAPDRSAAEAEAWVRSIVEPLLGEQGDAIEVLDAAQGALPALGHPILARLIELTGRPVTAKVGWTDVATFAQRGVPAANYGAGDPQLAHHPNEEVLLAELDVLHSTLRSLLTS